MSISKEANVPTKLTKLIPTLAPEGRLEWLWDHARTQDYAFDDYTRNQPEAFLYLLANPEYQFFELGDSGIFTVRNGLPTRADCEVHFICWDRNIPFADIADATHQLLEYLFKEVGVHRVNGYVPAFNRLAHRWVTYTGLKFEGKLREYLLWNKNYYDVDIFGMTLSDYERKFQ